MASEALFEQVRLLFHTLKHWSESLAEASEVSSAMRGVLERLLLDGPAPVPSIARARGVTRQHVQQQVDALLEGGLVERRENPAHRRSARIALTDAGRALIQTMRAAELDALSRLQVGVSDDATAQAADVLASWRNALRRDIEARAR